MSEKHYDCFSAYTYELLQQPFKDEIVQLMTITTKIY